MTSKTILKGYFNTGDVPTETQFAELIDSVDATLLNVLDYGAVGDGVTDNSVAFQAALDAANTGDEIYIPAGTYRFGTTLNIRKAIKIRGIGSQMRFSWGTSRTILEYTGASIGIYVHITTNTIIEGLWMSGFELRPSAVRGGTNGIVLDASIAGECTGVIGTLFENMCVRNWGNDGIQTIGIVWDFALYHCSMLSNFRYGFYTDLTGGLEDGVSQITFNDCMAKSYSDPNSWAYYVIGKQIRMIGGTVAGSNSGNGVWAKGNWEIIAGSIEGVDRAGTVGLRYSGTVGLYIAGNVHHWGINVQIGDPNDKTAHATHVVINGYISSGVTYSLQVVYGGNRSVLILNYGSIFEWQIDDQRATNDGYYNSVGYFCEEDEIKLAYSNGDEFGHNVEDTGFFINNDLTFSDSAWNAAHPILGTYHLWVDTAGKLRIKDGAPANATDGAIVGDQTA